MNDIVEVARLTATLLLELAPWFLFALLIAGLVDLLYLDVVARRSFRRKGWLGVVMAASLGAFSPFCSVTVIPLIRKLLKGGVPLSAVMAFWVASPAMDPEIFAMTAAQIGIPLATARLVGAVALSVGAGFVVLLMERRGMLRRVLRDDDRDTPDERQPVPAVAQSPALAAVPAGATAGSSAAVPAGSSAAVPAGPPGGATASPAVVDDEDDGKPWWPTAKASLGSRRNWRLTARNMARDGVTLGKWLVLACVVEALMVLYVPSDIITAVMGKDPLLAIPLAAAIGVPLYLNGVGAIPIVDGLLIKGMAPGAAVTFLLGGAVTTVPAMVAVRSVVNNRVFLLYLSVAVLGSILIGYVAQIVL